MGNDFLGVPRGVEPQEEALEGGAGEVEVGARRLAAEEAEESGARK